MSRAMQFDIVANDKASGTMQNVDKSMAKFGKGMASNLSMVAARAMAVVATIQKVAQTLNQLGDVSDQAARLGLSVEDYTKLQFAAEQYGSSIEEIAKAQKDVNKLLDAAATKKTGPEMETLQALGFSNQDIIDRNIRVAEVFERIGEAIKGAASEEEKFAVASRVFGDKISQSMVPVLENYRQFNALQASTVSMSQKSADNLDRAGEKLNGFFNFVKQGAGEIIGRGLGKIMDEQTAVPAPTAQQQTDSKKTREALLKVGAKTDAGKGAGGVSSMMEVGAASFRGFQTPASKPIEEQQLAELQKIASNTTSTPPPPAVGSTDMSKGSGTTGIPGLGKMTYKPDILKNGLQTSPKPRPAR